MLIFFISLFLVICLHESAHLIAAKLCKCGVEVFSIGFGKALWKKKIGNTIYQFSPILLGGYNKLKDELSYTGDKDSFTNLAYTKKVIISLAGCLINIVLGIISTYFALKFNFYTLFYFGALSILLGISNLLPLPALDGSYPFLFLLEKIFGKQKVCYFGNKIFNIFLKIFIISNLIILPWFLIRGIKIMNEIIYTLWYYYKLGL